MTVLRAKCKEKGKRWMVVVALREEDRKELGNRPGQGAAADSRMMYVTIC